MPTLMNVNKKIYMNSVYETNASGVYTLWQQFRDEDWSEAWGDGYNPHKLPLNNTYAYFSKHTLEIVMTNVDDVKAAHKNAKESIQRIIDRFYPGHPELYISEGLESNTVHVSMRRFTIDGFPTRSKVGLFTLTCADHEVSAEIMGEYVVPSVVVVMEYLDTLQK